MENQVTNYETDGVDAALADYMRRIDAEQQIDTDSFVAEYPQFADELRGFFESAEIVKRMAGPPLGSTVKNAGKSVETHDTSISDSVFETPTPQTQSTDMDTLPEIFGRYRIEKQLGRGAMGAVYLAHDTQLDRRVALKTPTFDAATDAELVERFYREARAAANLRHAGICPIFDVGKIDGTHYISMAYIEGKPMSALVDVDKPLPIRSVVSLVRKIALALDHAHNQGVIHRDLKPANIMIDKQKQPLIMDFGLARRVDKHEQTRLTQDGMILGTPAYMSPEQIDGNLESGKQSDVYSLGVILYELLTGDLPFQGTIAAVIGQIMTQDAPAPSGERPEVDPALDAICRKMMARKIEDRYAGTKEAADALTDYLKGKASRNPASQSSRVASRPATQTVTADEGLAEFLGAASQDEFPAVKTRRDGTLTQLVAPWKKLPPRAKVIATSALAGMLLVMSVVFMLRTPEGTVRVEVLGDEEVEVLIDGQSIKLTDGEWSDKRKADKHTLSLEVGGQQIPFDAASKTFRLADGSVSINIAGVVITGGKFQVVRGDKTEIVLEVIRPSKPKPLLPPLAGTGSLKLVRQIDEVRLQGPDAGVYDRFALAFQPNQESALRIVHSMTPDGKLEIRDALTGNVVRVLDGLPEQISSAAFSADGSQLIVGTEGQQAKVSLWNLTGEKPTRVFGVDVEGPVTKVQFDVQGRIVAIHGPKRSQYDASGRLVRVDESNKQLQVSRFDSSDGRLLASFKQESWNGYSSAAAAVNPAGTTVLHRDKEEWRAVRHDLASGAALPGDLPEHSTALMAYSPGGEYLATWGHSSSAVVANARSGKEIWRLGHSRSLSAAAFSPNDRYLVTAENFSRAGARVSVWDLHSGKKISEAPIPVLPDLDFTKTRANLRFQAGTVISREIAFAPNARHFALAAAGAPLTVWEIEGHDKSTSPAGLPKPQLVNRFDHDTTNKNKSRFAVLSPDAKHVAYLMEGRRRLFDRESEKEVNLPEKMRDAIAFDYDADGSHFATGHADGKVRLWHAATMKPVGEPLTTESLDRKRGVCWVSLSADGSRLLALNTTSAGDRKSQLYAWETGTGKLINQFEISINLLGGFTLDASDDGRRLVLATSDDFIQRWNVDIAEEIQPRFSPQQGRWFVQGMDLSPNGKSVAFTHRKSADGARVRVLDFDTGKELWSQDHGGGMAYAVRFSPDGRRLVSVGGPTPRDDHMHMWDATTGKELLRWRLPMTGETRDESEYGPWVKFLSFAGDGKHLLTGAWNSPVCVWKLEEHRLSGKWIDLLSEIDPEDAAERGWAKTDDGWRVATEKAIDVLAFERRPTASYELHATARFHLVTAGGGVSGNVFNLPVADRAVSLRLNGTELSLRLIDPKPADQPPPMADLGKIERDRPYRFDFLVEPVGDEVRIRVDVDSQRVIEWSGPIASILSPDNTWTRLASDGDENALGLFAHRGGTRLESFRLREIGGEWVPPPRLAHRFDDRRTSYRRNFVVAFSPAGHLVDSAHQNGVLRTVDVVSGNVQQSPFGEMSYVRAVGWSGDGTKFITAMSRNDFSQEKIVQIWERGNDKPSHEFEFAARMIRNAALSPDGNRAVVVAVQSIVGRDGQYAIRSWDLKEKTAADELTVSYNPTNLHSRVISADISADASLVAVAFQNGIDVWDVATGKRRQRVEADGERGDAWVVRFSRDGRKIVWGVKQGRVYLSDVESGRTLQSLDHGSDGRGVNGVAISPDSTRLAAGDGRRVTLWDAETGRVLRRWKPPKADEKVLVGYPYDFIPRHVVFSPDGRYLATAGHNTPLCLWDLSRDAVAEGGAEAVPTGAAPIKEDPAQRAAAELLLQRAKLSIGIEVDGQHRKVESADDLPADPFIVVGVDFHQGQKLTEGDLAQLAAFSALNHLSLNYTTVTEAMLKHVGDRHSLKSLSLQYGNIDDTKLSQLKGPTELEHLLLGGTQVGDAGLQHLSGMKSLVRLGLFDTKVSGSNLTVLEGLKQLTSLKLGGPNFTDKSAALASLKKMTGLRRLQLVQVELTDEEQQEFEAALPKCAIEYLATDKDDLKDDADDVAPENE